MVGSAAVQLTKRRSAVVIAMTTPEKADQLRALGADRVMGRNADLIAVLGRSQVDVVYDLVAGPQRQTRSLPKLTLAEIAKAQMEFLAKKYVGKLVLIPEV